MAAVASASSPGVSYRDMMQIAATSAEGRAWGVPLSDTYTWQERRRTTYGDDRSRVGAMLRRLVSDLHDAAYSNQSAFRDTRSSVQWLSDWIEGPFAAQLDAEMGVQARLWQAEAHLQHKRYARQVWLARQHMLRSARLVQSERLSGMGTVETRATSYKQLKQQIVSLKWGYLVTKVLAVEHWGVPTIAASCRPPQDASDGHDTASHTAPEVDANVAYDVRVVPAAGPHAARARRKSSQALAAGPPRRQNRAVPGQRQPRPQSSPGRATRTMGHHRRRHSQPLGMSRRKLHRSGSASAGSLHASTMHRYGGGKKAIPGVKSRLSTPAPRRSPRVIGSRWVPDPGRQGGVVKELRMRMVQPIYPPPGYQPMRMDTQRMRASTLNSDMLRHSDFKFQLFTGSSLDHEWQAGWVRSTPTDRAT